MKYVYTFLILAFIYPSISFGQAVNLVEFSSGVTQPTDITNAGGSELYVAERTGRIRLIDANGVLSPTAFLNITDRVSINAGERGLLGVAFHPSYPDSAYVYCNYTGAGGATFVSRFDVTSATAADPGSELNLLTFSQPFTNHNGGDLVFDSNGYLMIASGDGGSGGDPQNNGQDLNTFLGKILRIDVDNGLPYAIPPGNPFVGVPGVKEEIWAYGLRNPWRIDFDETSQALFVADVGQNEFEEINEIALGLSDPNMGWRCYEATTPYNLDSCEGVSTIDPIAFYAHRAGAGCTGSVTGGVVYRGFDMPSLFGKYFFADYCTGYVATVDLNNYQVDTIISPSSFRFSTFGEDAQGRLYVGERNSGKIYRFETEPPTSFIFTIDLDGAQASTPSTATGYGIGTLDTSTNVLTVSGQFTELIGNVTVAHVHRAPAGSNGPVVFPLSITDYGTDSIGFFGSGTLGAGALNDLLSNDGLYVNIHSSTYGGGEIRGQIIRVDCPLNYALEAPILPGGEFKIKNATVLGNLTDNRSLLIKASESTTLKEGFTMSMGTTLDVISEICGP